MTTLKPSLSANFVGGKDYSIETLRGIAIVLVVVMHAVESAAPAPYFYAIFSISYITIPLFTAISGYIYAMRPIKRGSERKFFTTKARRILLPLLSVGSLEYIAAAMVSEQQLSDIWRIFFFGFGQFWYLESLFLVFIVLGILELLSLLDTFYKLLLCTVISATVSTLFPVFDGEPLNGLFYILPYFLMGTSLQRFSSEWKRPGFSIVALLITVGGTCIQHLAYAGVFNVSVETNRPLGVITALASLYVVFYWRRSVSAFNFLGKYSFAIYLFHPLGISAANKLVDAVWNTDTYLVEFVVKLLVGVAVGVVAEKGISRISILRKVFLGGK